MHKGVGAALAVLAFGVPAVAKPSNLIKDRSFERPAPPPGTYVVYGLGKKVGAWTVVGPAGSNVAVTSTSFTQGGYSFPAKKGQAFVDLTGTADAGLASGVAQTVTTSVGATYKLTFWVGNDFDLNHAYVYSKTSTVNVYNGSTLLISATNKRGKGLATLVWKKFAINFVATSTTTMLSFISGDPKGDKMCGLDAVDLVEVGAAN